MTTAAHIKTWILPKCTAYGRENGLSITPVIEGSGVLVTGRNDKGKELAFYISEAAIDDGFWRVMFSQSLPIMIAALKEAP